MKGRYFVAYIEKTYTGDETLEEKKSTLMEREKERERGATIGKVYSAVACALVVLYKHEAAVALLRQTNSLFFFFLFFA